MEVDPGLCGRCGHVRIVGTRSASRFYLCELSRVLPQFPRYPRLPVLRCGGFNPAPAGGTGAEEGR